MEEKKDNSVRRRGFRHKDDCPCLLCENIQRGQPKVSVGRSAGQLRRKRFLQAFTDPDSKDFANGKASAISAGYSEGGAVNTASRLLQEPEIRQGVIAAQEGIGIDADYLSRKLKESLGAKETRFFSDKGVVTDERKVPDNNVRLKALELAHRLRGDFPQEEKVQVAALILKIGDGPATPEEWEAIAEREQKVGSLLSERLEREGYPADPDEYSRWRKEAEAQVRSELVALKALEQSDTPDD